MVVAWSSPRQRCTAGTRHGDKQILFGKLFGKVLKVHCESRDDKRRTWLRGRRSSDCMRNAWGIDLLRACVADGSPFPDTESILVIDRHGNHIAIASSRADSPRRCPQYRRRQCRGKRDCDEQTKHLDDPLTMTCIPTRGFSMNDHAPAIRPEYYDFSRMELAGTLHRRDSPDCRRGRDQSPVGRRAAHGVIPNADPAKGQPDDRQRGRVAEQHNRRHMHEFLPLALGEDVVEHRWRRCAEGSKVRIGIAPRRTVPPTPGYSFGATSSGYSCARVSPSWRQAWH